MILMAIHHSCLMTEDIIHGEIWFFWYNKICTDFRFVSLYQFIPKRCNSDL